MQRGPCHAETVYDFAVSGITKAVAAGAAGAAAARDAETDADAGTAAVAAAGDSTAAPSAIAVDRASA
jgi:hypothetical protein